jgi:hypothetical protein
MTAKLSLNVDQLQVESFQPQALPAASRGTVRGNEATVDTCYDYTCRGYGTCGIYPCKQVP